mmetsp:Transcript_26373/g.68705  ORF Transcript_26373/g.68705 Transcript_26373/m.68705 type:complete len:313 (-) Transcript_26373:781-1719(-)
MSWRRSKSAWGKLMGAPTSGRETVTATMIPNAPAASSAAPITVSALTSWLATTVAMTRRVACLMADGARSRRGSTRQKDRNLSAHRITSQSASTNADRIHLTLRANGRPTLGSAGAIPPPFSPPRVTPATSATTCRPISSVPSAAVRPAAMPVQRSSVTWTKNAKARQAIPIPSAARMPWPRSAKSRNISRPRSAPSSPSPQPRPRPRPRPHPRPASIRPPSAPSWMRGPAVATSKTAPIPWPSARACATRTPAASPSRTTPAPATASSRPVASRAARRSSRTLRTMRSFRLTTRRASPAALPRNGLRRRVA